VEATGSVPARSRAGIALLVAVLVLVGLKYLGTTSAWKLTHWLFSWELGFVKRGLVGTVVQAFSPGGIVTSETIVAISLIAVAGFLVALGVLAAPLFADAERRRSLAIGLVALLAPGVGYVVSDLGRFDVLNLALCILTILAAQALGRFPYALLLGVSGFALLIHEAALLLCLPLLFVAHLEVNGRLEALAGARQWPRLALLAAPPAVLFVALAGFGLSDRPLPELVAHLSARADFAPSPRSAYVLLRPLGSNVAQVLGAEGAAPESGAAQTLSLGSVDALSFWLILAVAALQQAFAHFAFAGLAAERTRAIRLALHGCFLAPFLLMAVGVDWARWVAAGSVQCAVLMLLFARRLPPEREAPITRSFALGALLVIVVAASAGIPMQGARRGIVMSPQAGVLSWWRDHQASDVWYRAFARQSGTPRRPAR
jgi:hypothetical protein